MNNRGKNRGRNRRAQSARRPPLRSRLRSIELLAMDVDGTLTDGTILLSATGDEIKGFCAHDGVGLKMLHMAGLHSAFVTARASPAVERRARELGVRDVVLNSQDKGSALRELCARRGVAIERVAFVGDDVVDLPAMRACGVAIAVNGAPPEVCERADVVTKARGGAGAVREAIETILRAQGRFERALAHFLS